MSAPLPALRLHDTATGSVRELSRRNPGEVSMYVCGPTVYGPPHLGHGRFLLEFDTLRRYLSFRGEDVTHVQNVTDIDDKIINRSMKEGVPFGDVASRYEQLWWETVDTLGVLRPTTAPRATEWVPEMVALVEELLVRGAAYRLPEGVYLDVSKVEGYGLLTAQDLSELSDGARVAVHDGKRNPGDFALWKTAKSGEPSWPAPFGDGRPGWHTECVVMSLALLGDGFDLHGGGADLAFPHHENERAQAVVLDRRFAGHWVHNGFVTDTGGMKMGKSLGNAVDLPTLVASGDPRAYRVVTLRAHYRAPLVVDTVALDEAGTLLRRLDEFGHRAGPLLQAAPDPELLSRFHAAMSDDLDTPAGFALLLGAIREGNRFLDSGAGSDAAPLAGFVSVASGAFGLTLNGAGTPVPVEVTELVTAREAARTERRWADSDRLREEIASLGWEVRDVKGSPPELRPRR